MSIVKLQKVTLAGLMEDKEQLLDDLQTMGCLQVVPLGTEGQGRTDLAPSPGAREALRFLKTHPQRRRQVRDPARFDAAEVERQVLDVRQHLQQLEDERDFLIRRIQAFEPWGDFDFPPPEALGGYRLWFYPVPFKDLAKVQATEHIFEIVGRRRRHAYVVVIAKEEPRDFPAARVHVGDRSRRTLEDRLDEVELALEDAQAERAYLTRWYELLRRSLDGLEDLAERARVSAQTYDRAPVFALHGWAPVDSGERIAGYARERGIYFLAEDPGPDDRPPSYLQNPSWFAAGEDLVNFYMTPGYRTWDPSVVVFVSFALFFGMILSDAGYAAVLGAFLLLYWSKMGSTSGGKRFRALSSALVGCGLVWGMLIGSWFGVAPPKESLLGKLHVLDMNHVSTMMVLSVVIGGVHVILANVFDAWRRERWIERLAPLGWALVVTGGLGLGAGTGLNLPSLNAASTGAMGVGLMLVLLFSEPHEKLMKRLLGGLHGVTEISRAFGDVLSYLRLCALGMASASLATAFNDMAKGLVQTVPGAGLLFALLLLIVGHSLNIVLGIAAAVMHGLRLNVIEFFNWGLKEEGTLFRPFQRKQGL